MENTTILNTIGYLLEIGGFALNYYNTEKILPGMWMRNSNALTPEEKRKQKLIKRAFGLVIFGSVLQMISPFFKK